ncbi:MAG: hypothetical protein SGBAC_008712 [Bacillariaceae sp.]
MVAQLQGQSDEEQSSTEDAILSLSDRQLQDEYFTESEMQLLPLNLMALDLSRNSLRNLPSQVLRLSSLLRLDVSRNGLRSLPLGIKNLSQLKELIALSNQFRLSRLPLNELASLHELRVLDLRYNKKLKSHAHHTITGILPPCVEVRCTIPDPNQTETKLSACDRDPSDLQSQLEPLSTPQLRKRLDRTFGIALKSDNEDSYDRTAVMSRLLAAYQAWGPRQVRQERGILLPEETMRELLHEMEAIHWPHTTRERPKIKAEYYMILQKPGSGQVDSKRTRLETAKLDKYQGIFDAAVRALQLVDPDFARRFTAVAVTKNFTGSPHIDTLNVGPFYGLSMGDFNEGGGKIAVECSATLVAEIDTRNRLAKVDGRFPHWVTPYDVGGTRYSLIYYVTSGEVEPQTTAIFPPPPGSPEEHEEWISPPSFML